MDCSYPLGTRPALTFLLLAAAVWIGVHIGIAGTGVRTALAGRIGDGGFRAAFSLVSVAAIALLIVSYGLAKRDGLAVLWSAPVGLRWLLVLAMAPAFVLFVGSLTVPNPTAVGGERVMGREPRGILRVTRHPMLWSFAIWAAVHAIGNGDLASLLFFGAFGVTALAGMPSIDAKLARRDPQGWAAVARATSIVPFAAIAAGRNRFAPTEIGLLATLGGLALWLAVFFLHPWLFGVSPVG